MAELILAQHRSATKELGQLDLPGMLELPAKAFAKACRMGLMVLNLMLSERSSMRLAGTPERPLRS